MIYASSDSILTLWEKDEEEKYAVCKFSSSRKDKRTNEYVNSSWSYIRCVGKAFDKIKNVQPRNRITNISFALSNEPYMKDGTKVYPKSPRMVIFDFEEAEVRQKSNHAYVDTNEPDDLPF